MRSRWIPMAAGVVVRILFLFPLPQGFVEQPVDSTVRLAACWSGQGIRSVGRWDPRTGGPRFAAQDVAPDNLQSLSVTTQLYPSSSGRRPLTLIWQILIQSVPGLPCLTPRCPTLRRWCRWYWWTRCLRMLWTGGGGGVVVSPELDAAVMDSDTCSIMSLFSPLNPLGSPVSMVNVDQVVVELLTSHSYDTPVVQLEISPIADHLATLNPLEWQVSRLSPVQLSPNRVCEDFDFNTLDVFPVFAVSDGSLPCVSPVSSPSSLVWPAAPTVGSAGWGDWVVWQQHRGWGYVAVDYWPYRKFTYFDGAIDPAPGCDPSRQRPGRSIWCKLTEILFHHRGRFPRSPHHQRSCHRRSRLMHRLSRMPPGTTHWYPPG